LDDLFLSDLDDSIVAWISPLSMQGSCMEEIYVDHSPYCCFVQI